MIAVCSPIPRAEGCKAGARGKGADGRGQEETGERKEAAALPAMATRGQGSGPTAVCVVCFLTLLPSPLVSGGEGAALQWPLPLSSGKLLREGRSPWPLRRDAVCPRLLALAYLAHPPVECPAGAAALGRKGGGSVVDTEAQLGEGTGSFP